MKTIKISEDTLLCPTCNNTNLHQNKIITIFRDEEDKDGTETLSQRNYTCINRVPDADIPGRRDFAAIYFKCEHCTGDKILHIMQHKGETTIYWKS